MLPVFPGRETRREIAAEGRKLVSFTRGLLRFGEIQAEHSEALTKLQQQIADLTERVRALEAREPTLLARSETVATRAAAETTTDLARRIGHLEARHSGA